MMARVDETGSSLQYRYGNGSIPGSYEDDELIYRQDGMLPRAKLAEALEILVDGWPDEIRDISALLTPFEN